MKVRDTSFSKFKKYKKYQDIYDFESIECIVAAASTILVFIIMLWLYSLKDFNEIVNECMPLLDSIAVGLVGLLGFIVTGLAILTGSISNKVIKFLFERNTQDILERLLLSFYLLGFVSACMVLFIIILHIVSYAPINASPIIVILISLVLTYTIIFVIFYAVKLIGNCLEIFYIVNSLPPNEKVTDKSKSEIDACIQKYNRYRIIALEKIELSNLPSESLKEYISIIREQINSDTNSENEKIILEMILNQHLKD